MATSWASLNLIRVILAWMSRLATFAVTVRVWRRRLTSGGKSLSAKRPSRLRFGTFVAPFHRVGENPTLALKRDLDLIDFLDELNYDEAWIGEHHSAGWEFIASPELMIASAAARTERIKLGTGVLSLPYQHPLIVADRMVQLDHMTRGRAMLGVGPGALSSDAYMMGIDPMTQRRRMDESLGAIIALFNGEVVNMETDWFTLRDARLQMAPFSSPHMPITVASTFSPAGPIAAGKHGTGLLSVSASLTGSIASTWSLVETTAAKAGKTVSREDWRISIPVHLADSREEALRDVADLSQKFQEEYFEGTLGRAPNAGAPNDIASTVARGGAVVGTPDDAIAAVERLLESTGGFGCLLLRAHEWTSWEKTKHSFELWARYVAPRFQGQLDRLEGSREWVSAHRSTIFGESSAAVGQAFADAGITVSEDLLKRTELGRR